MRQWLQNAQENFVFPSNAGIVNVKTEFGAVGDGVTDDTEAIQNAINVRKFTLHTLYFPNGTYLVSKPSIGEEILPTLAPFCKGRAGTE
ncbi:MAG: hypothetical protein HC896_08705 [Bacteroidales bacterium]|nr:hypothetical protein [Bacteroidales bacterium]